MKGSMRFSQSAGFLLSALLMTPPMSSCGVSPWEQDSNDPTASDAIDEVTFSCDSATLGEYQDARESGLVMHHGLLRIERPSASAGPRGGRSCALVRTTSRTLVEKVREILDGKYPINDGFEATFALGRTASVVIERVDGEGKVLATENARASFVQIVR